MFKISNSFLFVLISDLGAELKQIVNPKTNLHYLWEGDESYWSESSPILFPTVGRMKDCKYYIDEKEYEIGCHGFLRNKKFCINNITTNSISFSYISTSEDYKAFPFKFKFVQKYTLEEQCLILNSYVYNLENSEMPFSIGFHPGFNVGIDDFSSCKLTFNKELKKAKMSEDCLFISEIDSNINKNEMFLDYKMFKNDALIFTSWNGWVNLSTKKYNIEFYSPQLEVLTLWTNPKKNSPYICVEPCSTVPGDKNGHINITNRRGYFIIKENECKEIEQKWKFC